MEDGVIIIQVLVDGKKQKPYIGAQYVKLGQEIVFSGNLLSGACYIGYSAPAIHMESQHE